MLPTHCKFYNSGIKQTTLIKLFAWKNAKLTAILSCIVFITSDCGLVSLIKTLVSNTRGRGFESYRGQKLIIQILIYYL